MFKVKIAACLICCTLALVMFPLSGESQEKVEGTVISTNLVSCSVVPGKVGTCEGTLVLESKGDGKARQMTVKVTRDTALKKGEEKVLLFQLQGSFVTVNVVTDKGEKVAQSVVMKTQEQ
ncbi:hypothetical protein EPO44_04060 [bacterium]|nr:MAG: hypothetical protein EPO44_04060 [bacterium]